MNETTDIENKHRSSESALSNLVIHLTPEQRAKFDAIRWLIGDGPIRSGRTRLMAVAFLEKANSNKEIWIRIFDHERSELADSNLMSEIVGIFECTFKDDVYKIEVDRNRKSFRIVYV